MYPSFYFCISCLYNSACDSGTFSIYLFYKIKLFTLFLQLVLSQLCFTKLLTIQTLIYLAFPQVHHLIFLNFLNFIRSLLFNFVIPLFIILLSTLIILLHLLLLTYFIIKSIIIVIIIVTVIIIVITTIILFLFF